MTNSMNGRSFADLYVSDPTSGEFVFVSDADGVNGSWYLESTPNTLTLDANLPWYLERRTDDGTLSLAEVAGQMDHSGQLAVEECRSLDSDANALTPNNPHLIDQQSSPSDLVDVDRSGNIQTDSNALYFDHEPGMNHSFLPDPIPDISTRIEMGNSQASKTEQGVQLPEVKEAVNNGPLTGSSEQSEVRESNNLFFHKEDGTVLAIRIDPTLGPKLFRGLSQQISPANQLPALPFALNPSTTVSDDGLESDAQNPPSTADASAQPSSPASDSNLTAGGSGDNPAPVTSVSVAWSSSLRPTQSARVVNVDAWVDGIFSLANGHAYDRDWMDKHNVNDNILEGVPSKHKLDVLVRQGAVIVGDKLCVTYHLSGNPVVIEGQVLPDSTSANLCVRIAPARADFDGILRRVQGPRDLVRGVNKEYAARYDEEVSEHWKAVRLIASTGSDFGTLFDVRQAYQVWTDEKAKWAKRNTRAVV